METCRRVYYDRCPDDRRDRYALACLSYRSISPSCSCSNSIIAADSKEVVAGIRISVPKVAQLSSLILAADVRQASLRLEPNAKIPIVSRKRVSGSADGND